MKLCSWSNEKQLKITLSTIVAKYVVTSQATLEPMWLRIFFAKLDFRHNEPTYQFYKQSKEESLLLVI
jgi:hypothetical protein